MFCDIDLFPTPQVCLLCSCPRSNQTHGRILHDLAFTDDLDHASLSLNSVCKADTSTIPRPAGPPDNPHSAPAYNERHGTRIQHARGRDVQGRTRVLFVLGHGRRTLQADARPRAPCPAPSFGCCRLQRRDSSPRRVARGSGLVAWPPRSCSGRGLCVGAVAMGSDLPFARARSRLAMTP